jgi:hypothetical protein
VHGERGLAAGCCQWRGRGRRQQWRPAAAGGICGVVLRRAGRRCVVGVS